MRLKESPSRSKNTYLYVAIITFVIFYLVYQFVKAYTSSLFYSKKDRINVLVYGPYTSVYSFGLSDNQDYIIPFSPDLKIDVPGGYGKYRVGSLGKLVKLDRKYSLYTDTFSLASLSFVEYYFTEDKSDLYYDIPVPTKENLKLNGNKMLFSKSNANFFDRVYLAFVIASRERENFKIIDDMLQQNEESYQKRSLGLFFQKLYRTENKNVQIMYKNNYHLAERMSSIIEGNGIRVSDISQSDKLGEKCRVIENTSSKEYSQTAIEIALFFHCEKGKEPIGEVYDIIFQLGDLEKTWEI